MTTTTLVFLLIAIAMVIVGLLLAWPTRTGGWRFRSRDVNQPSPDHDGDARRQTGGGPDALTPRLERETPARNLNY